jgi:hypothetical protein
MARAEPVQKAATDPAPARAADNGLLAPELANGITRVKGGGARLGNSLTAKQAQALLNGPDATGT